ncbi:hypothetical protein SAMN04489761_4287 [Tenacibaculum sp. MAR_2009_124]|uniref:hypothetical protein n=1 Tax=Tenacibaculum sp. MAR_2009_124 TaxID=1250059 RepID=UPI00089CA8A5|nr:hypothetical protein [Tenacibaculum sp. MAR_2009_124]SED10449.1 hypothetical protein SAMN04489761_4287 [Tenacibaculum sp. MAR_2009_124]
MVSINLIHRLVKQWSNTDSIGNAKPETIDGLVNASVDELYEEMFFDVNRSINRQNRGLVNTMTENTTEKIRERIQYYVNSESIPLVNNSIELPRNLRYIDVIYVGSNEVELCKNRRSYQLTKEDANQTYPIGLRSSNKIEVFPEPQSTIELSYLREPKLAKWTYRELNEAALFDPSKNDFSDIDIHASQKYELIIRILKKLGVNLKDKDITVITQNEEQKMFNKEIAN